MPTNLSRTKRPGKAKKQSSFSRVRGLTGGSASAREGGANAPNTSTLDGRQVFTPPPQFAGGGGFTAAPNTSTPQGPIYTPPPEFAGGGGFTPGFSSQLNYTPAPNFSSVDGRALYVPPPQFSGGGGFSSQPVNATSAATNFEPQQTSQLSDTSGTISEATLAQQFFMSPAGQFASGLRQGVTGADDPAGRDPFTQGTPAAAGQLAGILGSIYAIKSLGSIIGAVKSATKVASAETIGLAANTAKATSTAGRIASNTRNGKLTNSMLAKLGISLGGIAILRDVIGTYPFSAFGKEEALQTLGFGVKTAIDHGDLEGAQAALDQQREILNPDFWSKLKSKIPYQNVLSSMDEFYEAAKTKADIDQRVLDDMRTKAETGESDDDYWARIKQQRADEDDARRAADEAYYEQVRERMAEAKAADRAEDEAYWAQVLAQKEKNAGRQQNDSDGYWNAYYQELNRFRGNPRKDDDGPSKLNFGIL